ncbi:hypothetical protein AMEX_G15904 [Astyanax mexicanus]|uniref:Uncharacterized protein n=2 Tax=Astyanax mexicanus TaxID=7994 RepID=A0A3B1KKF1_ASTMX|nr:hypothetical protein AMEX_G15904 [Astyanax mexicanus]
MKLFLQPRLGSSWLIGGRGMTPGSLQRTWSLAAPSVNECERRRRTNGVFRSTKRCLTKPKPIAS